MDRVTTVALIERKPGITRSLFTRYWRDVHGVMAARIPGFETYTQYHVTALPGIGSRSPEPFEGFAVVTYANAADRAGLIESEITRHIHRDEQNVFRRALLFNLEAGGSRIVVSGDAPAGAGFFVTVPAGTAASLDDIAASLASDGLLTLAVHDLTSGDPAGWNATDVDDGGAGRRFVGVLHGVWTDANRATAALAQVVGDSGGAFAAYAIDDSFVMVEGGRPTHLALRGFDAMRTIEEAGATNQLEDAVVRAVYGTQARRG